jgi:hypothetical protein
MTEHNKVPSQMNIICGKKQCKNGWRQNYMYKNMLMKTLNLRTWTYTCILVAVAAQKCSMGYGTSHGFVNILSALGPNFLLVLDSHSYIKVCEISMNLVKSADSMSVCVSREKWPLPSSCLFVFLSVLVYRHGFQWADFVKFGIRDFYEKLSKSTKFC